MISWHGGHLGTCNVPLKPQRGSTESVRCETRSTTTHLQSATSSKNFIHRLHSSSILIVNRSESMSTYPSSLDSSCTALAWSVPTNIIMYLCSVYLFSSVQSRFSQMHPLLCHSMTCCTIHFPGEISTRSSHWNSILCCHYTERKATKSLGGLA